MVSGGDWAVTIPPPNRKTICEKNCKCNEDDFLLVLLKSSWTTFKTIFETLTALGTGHVTIIHDFRSFMSVCQRFFCSSS